MPRAHLQLVKFKVVAGHQLYTPVNETARVFANAIYASALLDEHVAIATKLGFSVNITELPEVHHG